MTAPLQIARDLSEVKAALLSSFSSQLDALFNDPPSTGRLAEEATWWVAAAIRPEALRRRVLDAPWKMINGIRMWCMDRRSGPVIHLGGEYTWATAARSRAVSGAWSPTTCPLAMTRRRSSCSPMA